MKTLRNFRVEMGMVIFKTVSYYGTTFHSILRWWVNHLSELAWNYPLELAAILNFCPWHQKLRGDGPSSQYFSMSRN